MKQVLALDVSKGKSYVVLYEEQQCLKAFEFEHTISGFMRLKELINGRQTDLDIVFEATGIYSRQLETFFQSEELAYCLLNPLRAKKQTDGLRVYKTDKSDAHKLAQSHYSFERRRKEILPTIYTELREIFRYYNDIHQSILIERNQLHVTLQQTFPEIQELYADNMSKLTLRILEKYPHPTYIKNSSQTKLKNFIVKNTNKKMSSQHAKTRVKQLIRLAENSYPSVVEIDFLVEKAQLQVSHLSQQMALKEKLGNQLIEKSQGGLAFPILSSIQGIGPLTSALLISELGDISRFETANKLNAYVGIDIRRIQSGQLQKKDRISKRGNVRVRMILFFTIRNMLRQQKRAPNHIVDYHYKLKKQPNPKKDKVPIVACMNNLLKVIHFFYHLSSKIDRMS